MRISKLPTTDQETIAKLPSANYPYFPHFLDILL